MKTRKTKSYIVLSSCYLGTSEDILAIYSNIAKEYGAETIHLGPVASDREAVDHARLSKKAKQMSDRLDAKISKGKSRTESIDKLEEDLAFLLSDINRIDQTVRARVAVLAGHFKNISFVVPPKSLPIKNSGVKVIERECVLSRYLYLSGIAPITNNATVRPVNDKALSYLRKKGHKYSWIVPHPVPAIVPYPRPGLNQAHNYYTVGSLKHIEEPDSRTDMSRCSFDPCALLVLVDQETGEFFANQLFIDYGEGKGFKLGKPMVLIDGQVFTAAGVKEAKSVDRATACWDDHTPDNHPGVLGCVRACNEMLEPATFINGGDACDMPSVNRHSVGLPGQREGTRILSDIVSLQKLLSAQTEFPSIKTRILLDSNHHGWLDIFVDKNPEVKGILDWDAIAAKFFPQWRFVLAKKGEQEIVRFGDFAVRHGHQERDLARAEKMFPKGKYARGHAHKFQAVHRAMTIGCGSRLAPDYTENQVNDWQSMFATFTKYEGITACIAKTVFHNDKKETSKFSYRNQIVEAKWFVIK
jgi:hypothetical protein